MIIALPGIAMATVRDISYLAASCSVDAAQVLNF